MPWICKTCGSRMDLESVGLAAPDKAHMRYADARAGINPEAVPEMLEALKDPVEYWNYPTGSEEEE